MPVVFILSSILKVSKRLFMAIDRESDSFWTRVYEYLLDCVFFTGFSPLWKIIIIIFSAANLIPYDQ